MPHADEGGSSGALTPPIVGSAPDTTFRDVRDNGFLVAPGFFAQDALLRYSAVYNPGGPPYFVQQYFSSTDNDTPGTLAIVMNDVKYQDALALAQRVEGDTLGIWGAVRFTRNLTNAPVTLEYHIAIHGC